MQFIICKGSHSAPFRQIFKIPREISKSEIMQKIVLFVEPTACAFETPVKIKNLFMNRFAIDEDISSEVLNIFEFDKSSFEMTREDKKQKGMDLIIQILH